MSKLQEAVDALREKHGPGTKVEEVGPYASLLYYINQAAGGRPWGNIVETNTGKLLSAGDFQPTQAAYTARYDRRYISRELERLRQTLLRLVTPWLPATERLPLNPTSHSYPHCGQLEELHPDGTVVWSQWDGTRLSKPYTRLSTDDLLVLVTVLEQQAPFHAWPS